MAVKVLMPKLGLTMKKGKIGKWLKNEGDQLKVGEGLLEVITEKIANVIEVSSQGILYKIIAEKGRVIPVTAPIAVVAEPGDTVEYLDGIVEEAIEELAQKEASLEKKKEAKKQEDDLKEAIQVIRLYDNNRKISPRAKKLAMDKKVDLSYVASTNDGKVSEKEILEYLELKAREESGKFEPLEGMRAIIAERMLKSSSKTARVTIFKEVDVTALQELRMSINTIMEQKGKEKISYTDLIAVLTTLALKEYPMLNAHITEEGIKTAPFVNMGIAVALDEGIIVPVVHKMNNLSLEAVSQKIKTLVKKARAGELESEDLQGGTFTITNLGMFDTDFFTPIINPPEAAILGIGAMSEKPVLINGNLEQRMLMTLSLSFDHQIIDGAPAAMFLKRLKSLMEKPHVYFQREAPIIKKPIDLGKQPEQLVNEFNQGIGWLEEEMPDLAAGFMSLMAPVFAEGELSTREKELIAVALSVYIKCEYCISHHVHKALEAGANNDEIIEAAGVAVGFGGGAAMAYTVTLLRKCLEDFSQKS